MVYSVVDNLEWWPELSKSKIKKILWNYIKLHLIPNLAWFPDSIQLKRYFTVIWFGSQKLNSTAKWIRICKCKPVRSSLLELIPVIRLAIRCHTFEALFSCLEECVKTITFLIRYLLILKLIYFLAFVTGVSTLLPQPINGPNPCAITTTIGSWRVQHGIPNNHGEDKGNTFSYLQNCLSCVQGKTFTKAITKLTYYCHPISESIILILLQQIQYVSLGVHL